MMYEYMTPDMDTGRDRDYEIPEYDFEWNPTGARAIGSEEVRQLDPRFTRRAAAGGIMRLAEGGTTGDDYASQVESIYQDVLGRGADPSGMGFYSGFLQRGMPADQVREMIMRSPEAQARSTQLAQQQQAEQEAQVQRSDQIGQNIQSAYQDILGRTPDQEGLDYWAQQKQTGMSPEDFRTSILQSPEAAQRFERDIRDAYTSRLGREADPEGLEGWMRMKQSGELAPSQFQEAFRTAAAPEARERVVDSDARIRAGEMDRAQLAPLVREYRDIGQMTGQSADAMRYLMGHQQASPAAQAAQAAPVGQSLGLLDPSSWNKPKPAAPAPAQDDQFYGAAAGGSVPASGIAALARGGMKEGGFVVPADVVSMAGEGNTDAGYARLQRMLPGATPIKGRDGGQADTVKTSIEGKQPARVAHGEMYVPPAAVKRAGGAKKLYAMMDKVRKQAKGDTKQIKPVNLRKALA